MYVGSYIRKLKNTQTKLEGPYSHHFKNSLNNFGEKSPSLEFNSVQAKSLVSQRFSILA